jgi:hypothetical protein
MARSQFWGRDGLHVRDFRVGWSEAGLAVSVELYGDDKMGQYGYIVSFHVGVSVLHMMLYPQYPTARLAADVDGQWFELGTVPREWLAVTGSTVRAWFPSAMYAERFAGEVLATSPVDLHLDYIEGSRRELFMYSGRGRPTRTGE